MITSILLFGSRARGDYDERSDIDLAIKAPQIKEVEYVALLDEFEEMETLLKFDIVLWEKAPLELQEDIVETHKLLYCKSEKV